MTIRDVMTMTGITPEQVIILGDIERKYKIVNVDFYVHDGTIGEGGEMLVYNAKKFYFGFAIKSYVEISPSDKNNVLIANFTNSIQYVESWLGDGSGGLKPEVIANLYSYIELNNILFSRVSSIPQFFTGLRITLQ